MCKQAPDRVSVARMGHAIESDVLKRHACKNRIFFVCLLTAEKKNNIYTDRVVLCALEI